MTDARTGAPTNTLTPPAAPDRVTGEKALRVQALGSEALSQNRKAEVVSDHRRGPFRPERLVPLRERRANEAYAYLFRFSDLLLIAGVSLFVAQGLSVHGWQGALAADILPLLVAAVSLFWSLKSFDLYLYRRKERLRGHLVRVLAAITLSVVAGLAAAAISGRADALWAVFGLWAFGVGLGLGALHGASFGLVARWRQKGLLTPNIVIVGATRDARTLIEAALKRRDVNILGIFDDRLSRAPEDVCGVPVLGDTEALLTHKITPYVDRVVVAVDPSARARVEGLIRRLSLLPNAVSLLVDVDSEAGRKTALDRLSEQSLSGVGPSDAHRALHKRLQDILIGALALVIFAPVMAIVALMIRLDSPGPIFFRQRRHGMNNEVITVWKFRSMRTEAADPTAARQVSRDDDRVTRVGRFIRRTSLDELPQLFNVLKGDMSLVGPRPHAIGMKTGDEYSAKLVAEYAWRHRMKPGITGWAAIKGSRGALESAEDVRRRVQLDIDYIERQSFWFDLYIMAMTVPCILGDRDAVR